MRNNGSLYLDERGQLRMRPAAQRPDALVLPDEARQAQRGGMQGVAFAVIAGLILFGITRRQPMEEAPAPEEGVGVGGAQARNLNVGFVEAGVEAGQGINGLQGFTLAGQLSVDPGDVRGLRGYSFQYRGPANNLRLGWGIKPDLGFFGANFNNGDNLIARPSTGWGTIAINVNASADFVTYEAVFFGPNAAISIPDPAFQQINRVGDNVGLNYGSTDVWVWLAVANTHEESTIENNQLVLDTDANVFDIRQPAQPSAAGQQLTVTFG